MEKIKLLIQRPYIKHGFIAGIFLFSVKMVFLVSGYFEYRYSPSFPMLSFLPIYAALLISGKAECITLGEMYTYKKALWTAIKTISIAVIISVLADKIALETSSEVLDQAIHLERAQKMEVFKTFPNLYDRDQKDFIMANLKPNRWIDILGKMLGLIFNNGVLALFIANSTKYKKSKNAWLNSDSENS